VGREERGLMAGKFSVTGVLRNVSVLSLEDGLERTVELENGDSARRSWVGYTLDFEERERSYINVSSAL
jgi:hypothetical protein